VARRAIVGFHQDERGDWVAELECAHPQHVRHRPPMEERPWVQTDEGRRSKLGAMLPCLYCDMPALPQGAKVYKTTHELTDRTIPEGMLQDHRTRAGTWGRIVVRQGKLMYSLSEPKKSAWILRPGIDGIIAPGVSHWIAPHGPVKFVIEFLRAPARDDDESS
jgi:tellurite methyltransferase